ncbi:hypothetical protein GJ744_007089 [Endocarpon pusillum]|uniref:Uncharacterized protein n=1 Tax=Endocarpon pusillum TaxID=364733 RepID=A0A8H7E6F9_9EURO|nr:hypothetical protein GJ744_007089 [Endocarpon pusillum]
MQWRRSHEEEAESDQYPWMVFAFRRPSLVARLGAAGLGQGTQTLPGYRTPSCDAAVCGRLDGITTLRKRLDEGSVITTGCPAQTSDQRAAQVRGCYSRKRGRSSEADLDAAPEGVSPARSIMRLHGFLTARVSNSVDCKRASQISKRPRCGIFPIGSVPSSAG